MKKFHPTLRTTNLVLTVAWAVMLPIAFYTGWIYSVAFISFVSIYANFVSHLAAWRADVPIPTAAEAEILDHTKAVREHIDNQE